MITSKDIVENKRASVDYQPLSPIAKMENTATGSQEESLRRIIPTKRPTTSQTNLKSTDFASKGLYTESSRRKATKSQISKAMRDNIVNSDLHLVRPTTG